mgnify:CR=1 FL=1
MNTISTYTYRRKYRLASLDKLLRKALVAEKICQVDRSDLKYIDSPYGSQPTAKVQSVTGTYSVTAFTTNDDTLTVTDEFIYAEHIYDFEETLTKFDVWASRMDEQNYAIATAIDKWVVNELCENGNATYTTPAGGFTTAANINIIMSNLISKVAGYADSYKGLFLVIENTDIPGFIQAQATNGFSYADAALNNGWMSSYMGADIYVVREGTFVDAATTTASGSKTWTNSGHRVFGVKGVATYAAPRGVKYEEKGVTTKTGKELTTYGYCGFKLWTSKQDLVVDITIA